jgi:hypothetical protein
LGSSFLRKEEFCFIFDTATLNFAIMKSFRVVLGSDEWVKNIANVPSPYYVDVRYALELFTNFKPE